MVKTAKVFGVVKRILNLHYAGAGFILRRSYLGKRCSFRFPSRSGDNWGTLCDKAARKGKYR
jgi:hypothetical protein